MVSLETARAVNAALVKSRPITAVFVGGTSGIGEYTIRALAAHHGTDGPGLRVYIVGRNAESAANIIADCSKLCPNGDFGFVKTTDLSLLSDVDSCCEELQSQERRSPHGGLARIDLLVMSHSDLSFGGRRGILNSACLEANDSRLIIVSNRNPRRPGKDADLPILLPHALHPQSASPPARLARSRIPHHLRVRCRSRESRSLAPRRSHTSPAREL